MEFTNSTIKQGESKVGDFKMNYTITYDGEDKVSKVDAQIKRLSGEKGGEVYSGYASFTVATSRCLFQLQNATGDERKALFADFEKTIAELTK